MTDVWAVKFHTFARLFALFTSLFAHYLFFSSRISMPAASLDSAQKLPTGGPTIPSLPIL